MHTYIFNYSLSQESFSHYLVTYFSLSLSLSVVFLYYILISQLFLYYSSFCFCLDELCLFSVSLLSFISASSSLLIPCLHQLHLCRILSAQTVTSYSLFTLCSRVYFFPNNTQTNKTTSVYTFVFLVPVCAYLASLCPLSLLGLTLWPGREVGRTHGIIKVSHFSS